MLHPIQIKLLELTKKNNLAKMSLREMASGIDMPKESPQKIKHHLLQLQKKGFLKIDRMNGVMTRASSEPGWARGFLKKSFRLFAIPVLGSANCGPATIFAEQNFEGFLRVSGKLLGRAKPTGLYAIKTDGTSMNRAELNGKRIEDGDYVIVDGEDRVAKNNEIVLAIIDNKATIKRFTLDRENEQVVLRADSSYDYEPIYLHPDDEFSISGKVIAVIKK